MPDARLLASLQDSNVRRNDPCPCGSGKRYKDCHGALRPAGSESLSEIARAGLAQGRLEEAARNARAAIERDPSDAEAWTVLGFALETLQPDAALDAWRRAVALAPRLPEAHFRIAAADKLIGPAKQLRPIRARHAEHFGDNRDRNLR